MMPHGEFFGSGQKYSDDQGAIEIAARRLSVFGLEGSARAGLHRRGAMVS
jgi:hypothetical protein